MKRRSLFALLLAPLVARLPWRKPQYVKPEITPLVPVSGAMSISAYDGEWFPVYSLSKWNRVTFVAVDNKPAEFRVIDGVLVVRPKPRSHVTIDIDHA